MKRYGNPPLHSVRTHEHRRLWAPHIHNIIGEYIINKNEKGTVSRLIISCPVLGLTFIGLHRSSSVQKQQSYREEKDNDFVYNSELNSFFLYCLKEAKADFSFHFSLSLSLWTILELIFCFDKCAK